MTKVVDYVRRSHRDFLQTALFVDDKALEAESLNVVDPQDVVVPHEIGDDGDVAGEVVTVAADDARVSVGPVSESSAGDVQDVGRTNELVEALADSGVTCSVIAPRPLDATTVARIARLARRTDLVILDWNLGSGSTSAEIIRQLLVQDLESGGRLRLIVVYTAENPVQTLIDDLFAALRTEAVLRNVVANADDMVVTGDRFRVAFIRKRTADDYVGMDPGVSPEDLAGQVLAEFDALVGSGLLQQLALKSLSEVRDRAHHLLSRFDSTLDPAFIGHRAQTSHRDAVLFSLELLGTELASLVRSADISTMLSGVTIGDRVDQLLGDRVQMRQWPAKNTAIKAPIAADKVREFLSSPSENSRSDAGVREADPSVSSFLLDDGSTEDELRARVTAVEQRFALLSCLVRTRELDQPSLAGPVLEFGVVVCDDAGRYMMCLQPLCDSVRVKADKVKNFLFLPLVPSEAPLSFHLMVWDGKPVALKTGSLGSTCEFRFTGDATTEVVKSRLRGGQRIFETSDGTELRWIGTVRDAQARRIVQRLAENLTRVGLDESHLMVRQTPPKD